MAEKKEWLYTVKIFAYVDPIALGPVNTAAEWYREKKIVETTRDLVYVLRDGQRWQYQIMTYWFRSVKQDQIPRLIDYIKKNPKGRYRGWVHHANVYTGITKTFVSPQILIDHEY